MKVVEFPQMPFVGIDPSLRGTAQYCIAGKKQYQNLMGTEAGDFDSPFDRINHIVEQVMFYIPPDVGLVCIEEPIVLQGNNTIMLGALGIAIRSAMWKQKMPFLSIHISHLKIYATGNARASKAQVINGVAAEFGIGTNNDNIADACTMAHMAKAIYCYYMQGDWPQMRCNRNQLDVISKQKIREGFNLPWIKSKWQKQQIKPPKKRKGMTKKQRREAKFAVRTQVAKGETEK